MTEKNEKSSYKKAVQLACLSLAKQVWDAEFIAQVLAFQLLLQGHITISQYESQISTLAKNKEIISMIRSAVFDKLKEWERIAQIHTGDSNGRNEQE